MLVVATGCGASDEALVWSVRRGQVGEFTVHGAEVFTVGDSIGVYDAASGRRLRRAGLRADLGNITLGQIGPGVMVAAGALVFGWYDFDAEAATLFCVDAASLATRWEWTLQWPWRQLPLRPTLAVIADDRHVYAAAVGKDGDNLFAFRLVDGRLVWRRSVETFPAEAALALDGERLIVRSQLSPRTRDRHEQLNAIGVRDGRRLWRTSLTGEARYHLEPPVIHGGHLYTTTAASVLSIRPDRPFR